MIFRAAVALQLLGMVTLHPSYQSAIPNGNAVSNECSTTEGDHWAGVGHTSAGGGGSLNPFGSAFAAAGHTWTTALCEADSDGDGRSNGLELGDPNCTWTQGSVAPEPSTGHPGYCLGTPCTSVCTSATGTVTHGHSGEHGHVHGPPAG